MENASKALLIAGAILLSILIIAIGMFIYNSAQATVNDSMTSMSTQEIDAFNNQFVSYEQIQTGSNVKALIGRLIANANTYTEESAKVPKFGYVAGTDGAGAIDMHGRGELTDISSTDGNVEDYINALSTVRNQIENKHKYWITIDFGTSGVISKIQVEYGLQDDNGGLVYTRAITW